MSLQFSRTEDILGSYVGFNRKKKKWERKQKKAFLF